MREFIKECVLAAWRGYKRGVAFALQDPLWMFTSNGRRRFVELRRVQKSGEV